MSKTPSYFLLFVASCFVASETYNLGLDENHPLAIFKRQNGGRTKVAVQASRITHPLHKRSAVSSGCLLPPFPSNGNWELNDAKHVAITSYRPGQSAPKGTHLRYNCNDRSYQLYPQHHNRVDCNDEGWKFQHPWCIKICPSVKTTMNMIAKCTWNNLSEECLFGVYDGTQMELECIEFDTDSGLPISIDRSFRYCLGGSWDPPSTCEPKLNVSKCLLPESQTYYNVVENGARHHRHGYNSFKQGTILEYFCNYHYTLYPNNAYAYCTDDGWSIKEHPKCIKTCPPIRSTESMTAKCTWNNLTIDCETPFNGTRMEVECINFQADGELPISSAWFFRYCLDGSWDSPVKCEVTMNVTASKCMPPSLPKGREKYFHAHALNRLYVNGQELSIRNIAGKSVPTGTIWEYVCSKTAYYTMYTIKSYCNDDGWSIQEQPECEETCPPIILYKGAKCSRWNSTIVCQTPYLFATRVESGCISVYDNGKVVRRNFIVLCNGFEWKLTISKCIASINVDAVTCLLPPFPSNGKWEVFGIEQGPSYQPGQSVSNGTILQYKCSTQYALHPNNPATYCSNDGWSTRQPECLKTCSPLGISERMTAKCTLNDITIDCQTPYHGTQAEVECTSRYEDSEVFKRGFHFCLDGLWKPRLPNCEPICGLKSTKANPHVIGGGNTTRGEYPWMVGIYFAHNKKQICGGSIITPKITLTAAHCFKESQDPNYYTLAAGKYYREYNDTKDEDAVFSKIKMLKIHDNFVNGDNFFAYDIAIIVVETPFKLSRFIMPVCIDYDIRFNDASLVNSRGLVTGWGFTTSVDTPSDVLKVLKVKFLTETTCPLPESLRKFYILARDKMCVRSTNKDIRPVLRSHHAQQQLSQTRNVFISERTPIIDLGNENESTCKGDSGGPLIFKLNKRYYIRGIVSLGAPDKTTYGCDSNQVTLFTSVRYHLQFIQRFVILNGDTD